MDQTETSESARFAPRDPVSVEPPRSSGTRPSGGQITIRLTVFALIYVAAVLFSWWNLFDHASGDLSLCFEEFPLAGMSENLLWLILVSLGWSANLVLLLVVLTHYVPVAAAVLTAVLEPTRGAFMGALAVFMLSMGLWMWTYATLPALP